MMEAVTMDAGAMEAGSMEAAPARAVPKPGHWFYFAMAMCIAAIAVTGFFPSYLLKIGAGSIDLPLIYHVHATLFFAWCALNVSQTWLTARGRIYSHRQWGLLGVALGTAMAISVVLMVITGVKHADAHGAGIAARHFAYLNIAGAAKFSIFFGLAIAFARRNDFHKRFMVAANSTLLGAPIGRLVILALVPAALRDGPPPSYAILLIVVLGYSPVFAGIIFDWRTRGKPHPVYLIALVLGLGTALLTPLISRTAAWMTVVDHIVKALG